MNTEALVYIRIAIAWARFARRHPGDEGALSSAIEAMEKARELLEPVKGA